LEEQTYQHGGLFTLDMTAYATGVYSLDISKGYDTVRLKLVKK
jgi:hypothetical protein